MCAAQTGDDAVVFSDDGIRHLALHPTTKSGLKFFRRIYYFPATTKIVVFSIPPVFTPTLRFEDDGIKVNHQPSPGGFAELDITGLFLMAHLTGRGVTNDPPERATLEGSPVQRIRVRTGRSEVHYRQFLVRDEFNVFVNESGLLAGISREFYKDSPLFNFTLTFTFSDYRDTGGVILPYRIQRYVTGVKVETISIDTYETDIPVSPTLFQPRRAQ